MNYPAFTQQTEFCDHTITLCMNFDTWDYFQLACERAKFEEDRLFNSLEELEASEPIEKRWKMCAKRLWEILHS